METNEVFCIPYETNFAKVVDEQTSLLLNSWRGADTTMAYASGTVTTHHDKLSGIMGRFGMA